VAKAVVIVQARMTSTRLPGKVLLDLAGTTVLDQVLARCVLIPGADQVVCAVPDGGAHDPVAAEAEACGIAVVRGSETDVLSRYAKAADWAGADVVMRVTSDCPLIDPVVCGDVLNFVLCDASDYACNNMPRTFPHGLDCEAFGAPILREAADRARLPEEREHVTPWIRNNNGLRRASLAGPGAPLSEIRITLDTPADYLAISDVFRRVALPRAPGGGGKLARQALAGDYSPIDFAILDKIAAMRSLAARNG
jgi:spore coat polysaccharide biosynthesis protein SpsF